MRALVGGTRRDEPEALRERRLARWDELFAVVRDSEPVAEDWRNAVRALHSAVEDAGIPGGIGLGVMMGVGDWPTGPPPRSVGWVCPASRCARVDLPDDAVRTPDPLCALTGSPLRQVD
ncbi:hypothetical protein PV343_02945 [Streptomyces sp. WI03-4A]|uniref:hypothetical protein n=1 Tax=Streptomyces sp. WI03-4A TaxID=3028706 RepID=UPI0029B52F4C|nr:hypothetical protein [Streptomyces sp. WI03-4A]MDX2591280.1 hypothetical protein [Streptomyces sp. WI03-4A]